MAQFLLMLTFFLFRIITSDALTFSSHIFKVISVRWNGFAEKLTSKLASPTLDRVVYISTGIDLSSILTLPITLLCAWFVIYIHLRDIYLRVYNVYVLDTLHSTNWDVIGRPFCHVMNLSAVITGCTFSFTTPAIHFRLLQFTYCFQVHSMAGPLQPFLYRYMSWMFPIVIHISCDDSIYVHLYYRTVWCFEDII